jgi:Flp pilus assembly protein TadG
MQFRPKPNLKRRTLNRGIAAVEAAIVLPIVVLLTFMFIEVGWYVNSLQILHNAARQGARVAVRPEKSNADVLAAVLTSLGNSIDVDPCTVTVRISKLNAAGEEEYEVMNLSENEQGHPMRVTATIEYAEMRPPANYLGLAINSITSSAVMQRSN